MLCQHLIDSYNRKDQARIDMHIVQNLAGMVFSNAILGIVHSMAHKSGKILDIPHGLANAMFLTYAIEFNAKTAEKDYADIARAINL